jgi:hypothetical protein
MTCREVNPKNIIQPICYYGSLKQNCDNFGLLTLFFILLVDLESWWHFRDKMANLAQTFTQTGYAGF